MIDQEIRSRMDAYRGNPQALAQKYSQNQELIDLLALQKLKSEKESAARDIQLKMGLGQMPTVADQREQEVMDMTKQEVAQQSAEVMQNKMRQRQEAIKQIAENPQMAGIASVPAPNIAPKMMAGGGIVAFNGETGSEVVSPERESLMQMAQRGIRTLLSQSPEDVYARRKAEAATEANYTPEERAARQRQLADRAAYDERYFNPQAEQMRAINRGLLTAAGGTSVGATLARMGLGIEGAREASEIANRQRLIDRQKQEQDLIDIGPSSRMAGLKYGSEAEKYATQGLHFGTDAATRLLNTLESAAARGDSRAAALAEKIRTDVERNIAGDAQVVAIKERFKNVEPGTPEYNELVNVYNTIRNFYYKRANLDTVPVTPIQPPPPKEPGFMDRLFGAGTPKPTARPAGSVDMSNPLLRTE